MKSPTRKTVGALTAFTLLGFAVVNACLSLPKSPFWWDEVLSHFLLADPDFRHMWDALRDHINCSTPLYWISAWGWARIFGDGELSLRLFSAVAIFPAAWFLFMSMARGLGAKATSIAIVLAFVGSRLVVGHSIEARAYSWFLAATAFALYATVRTMRASVRPGSLVLLTVSQAALVMTHTLGMIYAVVLLSFPLCRCALRRHWQKGWKILCAGVAGQMALLLWVPALRIYSQMDADKPEVPAPLGWLLEAYWKLVPLPPIRAIRSFLLHPLTNPFAFAVTVILGAGVVAGVICLLRRKVSHPLLGASQRRSSTAQVMKRAWIGQLPLLLLAVGLLVAPVLLWTMCQLRPGIFLARYCIPSVLGVAILLAWLARLAARSFCAWPSLMAAAGIYLALPLVETATAPNTRKAMDARIREFGQGDFVLCQSLWHSLVLGFHQSKPQFYYVLDESVALARTNTHAALLCYKTAVALRKHYHPPYLLTLDEAKRQLAGEHFFVIESPHGPAFHSETFLRPGLTLRSLGPLRDGGPSGLGDVFEAGPPVEVTR